MRKLLLKDLDEQDIEFVFSAIEKSFLIKFEEEELKNVSNIDDVCDLVCEKVNLQNTNVDIFEIAFDRVKKSFLNVLNIDEATIKSNTKLSEILPRKNRLRKTKLIEKDLKVKLHLLRGPAWVINLLTIITIIGFILLFVYSFWGISIIIFAILGFEFCKDYGKEFRYATFGDLVKKSVLYNYKRYSEVSNANDVEKIVNGLFIDILGFDEKELNKESKF
ncbi:hypothetical protein MHJ94_04515 [Chryseobacterium taklimakanense]|nr:hypothetical protein [Chryseobacterium taklimakanense]